MVFERSQHKGKQGNNAGHRPQKLKVNLEWRSLNTDTHIDNCSSEASSTQDKVCHVGRATRNPKGHVSHWNCCRDTGRQSYSVSLDMRLEANRFTFTDINIRNLEETVILDQDE